MLEPIIYVQFDEIVYNLLVPTMKEQLDCTPSKHNSFRIKAKSIKSSSITVSHYQIYEQIGKGGFATVFRAIQIHTQSEVAVKVIQLDELSSKDIFQVRREIQIHQQLDHPNIIKIYEAIQTSSHIYIFMELVKGDELFSYLNRQGPLHEQLAAKIFSQIISAVEHIHLHNIAHRDIKTENIMIDKKFNAKLIDFGLAKCFESRNDDYLETFCGSPSYVAPQILSHKKYSGQRVDVWCLGVTLYVMLEASLPFEDNDRKGRQNKIQHYNWRKPIYSGPEAIEIYQQIFQNEKLRYSIIDLQQCSFLKKYHLSQKPNRSMVLSKVSQEFDNNDIIEKTAQLIKLQEAQVKSAIKSKQIGMIYTVYQLLRIKANKPNSLKKRNEESCEYYSHRKRISLTLEPISEKHKIKQRPKSRNQHKIVRILPIIENGSKKEKDLPNGRQKKQYELALGLDIVSKEEIVKEAIKAKAVKSKNITISKESWLNNKARLREDSLDSPKRILDCVKRYN